jgi:hypothetical protein
MLTSILFHCPLFLNVRILSAINRDKNKPFGLVDREQTELQSSKALDLRTEGRSLTMHGTPFRALSAPVV